MVNQNVHIEEPKPTLAMQPKKFALWLFIVSIVMLFAALTSAYIVKQADGNWLSFELPSAFLLSSVIIVISSITMQMAYFSAKKDELGKMKIMLLLTLALGVAFLFTQFYSWSQLVASNVFFVSNYASGSFIYVFTGLHGVHLVSGLISLVSAIRLNVHSKKLLQIEMSTTYWHFLGGLWLYLYIFLLFNL